MISFGMAFACSMRAFAFGSALWLQWSGIELFEHRDTQTGQSVGRFMIFSGLIVAQKRKNQATPAGRIGKAGKRAHMLDGTGLRVDVTRSRSIFHAIFERTVHARHG